MLDSLSLFFFNSYIKKMPKIRYYKLLLLLLIYLRKLKSLLLLL